MAEQTQARMLSAAFPTPPPFYKHFTKRNVSRVRELRKEAAKNKETEDQPAEGPEIDVQSLPPELRYLLPPEPPANGRWKSFGINHDLAQPSQSLEASGIRQLYPDPVEGEQFDPTVHLTTLTRSIALNTLELVGTMSVNPTQGLEKVEDMQTLFYNVHDLINKYRPHQAKESLALLLEDKIEEAKSQTARIKEEKEKLLVKLRDMQKLADSLPADMDASSTSPASATKQESQDSAEKARQIKQRSMWDALDAELGD